MNSVTDSFDLKKTNEYKDITLQRDNESCVHF